MTTDTPLLFVILGPTGVGKTSLSIRIAKQFSAEILSADSRQFYREMKIGTAPPSASELQTVPHHFIGHLSIHDEYNVAKYETDALHLLENMFRSHRLALLTGGSGLYIRAICRGIDDLPDPDPVTRGKINSLFEEQGLTILQEMLREMDPLYYKTVDRSNPKRLMRALEVCMATGKPYSSLRKNVPAARDFRSVKIGLMRDKKDLAERINRRVNQMMADGFLEEAKRLYPCRDLNALNTVGYKELFLHIEEKLSLDEAIVKIKTNTRRYAKRQMTWFRKDEDIRWFDADNEDMILQFIRMEAGV
jgi:tRNA dimethylallyltransferase